MEKKREISYKTHFLCSFSTTLSWPPETTLTPKLYCTNLYCPWTLSDYFLLFYGIKTHIALNSYLNYLKILNIKHIHNAVQQIFIISSFCETKTISIRYHYPLPDPCKPLMSLFMFLTTWILDMSQSIQYLSFCDWLNLILHDILEVHPLSWDCCDRSS